jgi:isoquinoline 1-oxidoreductase beta subunit
VKRRHFVLGTLGAAGALVVGWGLLPPRQRLHGGKLPVVTGGAPALNAWVSIAPVTGIATVHVPRCEMGQGTHTGLAMLLADTLDVAWESVRVQASPIDPVYNNLFAIRDALPFRADDQGPLRRSVEWIALKAAREGGMMITGGSTGIRDLWEPLREAGAMARATLVDAAARSWGVPAGECATTAGRVTHPRAGELGYGAIVAAASGELPPARDYVVPPVAAAGVGGLLGRPLPRLDSPAKIDGSARFGADIREPDMLFAAVALCPQREGRLLRHDEAAARALRGVQGVLRLPAAAGAPEGIAVVARDTWTARRALAALNPAWDPGPVRGADDAEIARRLGAALQGETRRHRDEGDVDAALAAAARVLRADYAVPYLAHAAMEPLAATARVEGRRATIWAGVQAPDLARKAAAKALEIDADDVDFVQLPLGGSFGRRIDPDIVVQAALVARQLPGRTIQVAWSREDDLRHDFYRPACVARLAAGLDAQGRLVALHSVSASQSVSQEFAFRFSGFRSRFPDRTTVEGIGDQAYPIPHLRVEHATVQLPLPVGYWRSVGHSHQAFFGESFIDELAAAAGADPLAYRESLLAGRARELGVLRRAAREAGWGTPAGVAPDGAPIGRGIALHASFGSFVATVIEASLTPGGAPRAHRVTTAIDCGRVVNPSLVRQQLEGSVVFGLTAALYGRISVADGAVVEGNFDGYPLLRLAECPRIDVLVVPSEAPPGGVGEPGVPPVAPALANALFALDGVRRRRLPLAPG